MRTVYDKFRRMPPLLQKSSLIATAAVAEAGLLYVKEDYELVEALLRDEVAKGDGSEEMMLEYQKCKVVIDMMDRIIAVLHEEKGEVNGELVSNMPSVSQN